MSHCLETEYYDGSWTARQVKQHVYREYFGINLNGKDEFNDWGFGRSSASKEKAASHFAVVDDKVFDTEKEGNDYVYSHFKHDQQDDGYAFKVAQNEKTSEMKRLEDQIEREYEKGAAYAETHHAKNRSAQFVGCQHCKSKLNRSYIPDNNKCPVCGTSLYSKTDTQVLERYSENIEKWKKQLKQAEAKANKRKKTYWYASIQYYK